MKTIIAGGRSITNYELVCEVILESGWQDRITEVVCGDARGVDTLGEHWAETHNIPVQHFPADWTRFGKGAGHIRNEQMAQYAEAAIVVWDGSSKGSASMLRYAKQHGLQIYEHIIIRGVIDEPDAKELQGHRPKASI